MITFNLVACLSTILIVNVSGNMFNPFSSFSGFPSFPSFPNPFVSPFGSSFGSGFPFAQSYGSPFTSDDPFASSPFPFQPPNPSFFTSPSSSGTSSSSSSSSPFPSPFSRGFPVGSFGFPSFPSFPSFTDLTNGLANGDLKGNGIKVTTTSTSSGGSSKAGGNSPGQVIQTIKVEKIGSENGPGEERRIVQTIRASGPLITTTGFNSHQDAKGNKTNRPNQSVGQRPIKLNNNQSQPHVNQKRNPQRPLRPTTTSIVPPTGLKINGTQSTSAQQSTVLNNSAGKPTSNNNNQLSLNPGNIGSGTSFKVSSSTTAGNMIGVNKSPPQSTFGSQNSNVNSAGGRVTSFNSVNSDQSATAKSGGVTVRRVDSSGRIINGF